MSDDIIKLSIDEESNQEIEKEEESLNISNDINSSNEEENMIEFTFGGKSYKIPQSILNNILENIKVLPTFDKDNTLSKEINQLTKIKNVEEKIKTTDTYENILMRMLNEYSNQFLFLHETLKELVNKHNKQLDTVYKAIIKNTIKDDESQEEQIKEKEYVIKDSYPEYKKQLNGKILSGDDVKIYSLIKSKNIKKIILPNSGVYMLVKNPHLNELNILYNRLIDTIGEYGYLFGHYFYLFYDYNIKEVFLDMIKEHWIHDTNIKDWRKGNNLWKNISIHDYPVILQGIASLMFKSGYDYVYICPQCKYKETTTINVDNIKHYILSMIPEEGIKFLYDTSKKSNKDLKRYREEILDIKSSFFITPCYKLNLSVPTIERFMSYGDKYNSDLSNTLHDSLSKHKIQSFIRYSYFKLFLPWIESIEYYENGNLEFITTDSEGIEFILNDIQNETNEEYEKVLNPIIDFIKKSSLTFMGIPLNPCPKCNSIPENTIKGLLPVDIQEHFFSMSAMRLQLK